MIDDDWSTSTPRKAPCELLSPKSTVKTTESLAATATTWAKLGSRWQSQFLIVSADPGSGSWLSFCPLTGVGCTVCHAAARTCEWGRFEVQATDHTPLHMSRLKRHAGSKSHLAALDARLQTDVVHSGLGSPSVAHFRQVLEDTLNKSGAVLNGIPGIGARQKVRRMQWCLAEARRRFNQAFWLRCGSMTIAQDKRATRLLIRWRAATPELEMRSGVFGLLREVPDAFAGLLGADATLASTTYAILRACSATEPPYISPAPEVVVDDAVHEHLRNIVEVFSADAATDEQLVGRELTAAFRTDISTIAPVLPNVKMVAKDPSHAAKRSPTHGQRVEVGSAWGVRVCACSVHVRNRVL